jgi:hypothetical protein
MVAAGAADAGTGVDAAGGGVDVAAGGVATLAGTTVRLAVVCTLGRYTLVTKPSKVTVKLPACEVGMTIGTWQLPPAGIISLIAAT